jgi:hypothetical protein
VLTDRNEDVVEMLNQNIELNSVKGTAALWRREQRLTVTHLCFADKAEGLVMKWVDDVPAVKEKYPPFEVIIGTLFCRVKNRSTECLGHLQVRMLSTLNIRISSRRSSRR